MSKSHLVILTENRKIKIQEINTDLVFEVKEPHLFIGLFDNGLFVSPLTNLFREAQFQKFLELFLPLELYLMTNTNINVELQSNQFRQANVVYDSVWKL